MDKGINGSKALDSSLRSSEVQETLKDKEREQETETERERGGGKGGRGREREKTLCLHPLGFPSSASNLQILSVT